MLVGGGILGWVIRGGIDNAKGNLYKVEALIINTWQTVFTGTKDECNLKMAYFSTLYPSGVRITRIEPT
jgi:hypothetical protein